MKLLASLLVITWLVLTSAAMGLAQHAANETRRLTIQQRVARLENEVATLTQQLNTEQQTIQFLGTELGSQNAQHAIELGNYVTVTDNAIDGLNGPNIIFSGANLHVRSGSGSTTDTTGLGNVIVGYDEDENTASVDSARTGSHNLVGGAWTSVHRQRRTVSG